MGKFTKDMVDDYADKLLIGLTDEEVKIIVETGKEQNEVIFKFAQKMPKDFYKADGKLIENSDVLKMLFGNEWEVDFSTTYDTTKISITTSSEKTTDDTLKVVFENGFIKEESVKASNNLGYYTKEFDLNNPGSWSFVDNTGGVLSKLYVVFEKNLLPIKNNTKKVYPYSARFVTEDQYKAIEKYQSIFKEFNVTFSPAVDNTLLGTLFVDTTSNTVCV